MRIEADIGNDALAQLPALQPHSHADLDGRDDRKSPRSRGQGADGGVRAEGARQQALAENPGIATRPRRSCASAGTRTVRSIEMHQVILNRARVRRSLVAASPRRRMRPRPRRNARISFRSRGRGQGLRHRGCRSAGNRTGSAPRAAKPSSTFHADRLSRPPEAESAG